MEHQTVSSPKGTFLGGNRSIAASELSSCADDEWTTGGSFTLQIDFGASSFATTCENDDEDTMKKNEALRRYLLEESPRQKVVEDVHEAYKMPHAKVLDGLANDASSECSPRLTPPRAPQLKFALPPVNDIPLLELPPAAMEDIEDDWCGSEHGAISDASTATGPSTALMASLILPPAGIGRALPASNFDIGQLDMDDDEIDLFVLDDQAGASPSSQLTTDADAGMDVDEVLGIGAAAARRWSLM
mmetsp:Transcript_92807/g.266899  ORF Transcript_92807/g.266899 Transcript_92807/m.266899 type:complete len:245 (-) Transcript_92807:40-774(-)